MHSSTYQEGQNREWKEHVYNYGVISKPATEKKRYTAHDILWQTVQCNTVDANSSHVQGIVLVPGWCTGSSLHLHCQGIVTAKTHCIT